MSANTSTAFFAQTDDGLSPRVGSALPTLFSGTGERLIVSGSPCRVGEVNCVILSFPPIQTLSLERPVIGATRLICDDSITQSFVQCEVTFAPVDGLATNGIPFFGEYFTLWEDSDPPAGLDIFATHVGTTVGLEYFIYGITTSIDGETYVATLALRDIRTLGVYDIFLVYAGEGRVLAGYRDTSAVVMYATADMQPASPYVDAKPLRTPVFRVEQTSAPTRPIIGDVNNINTAIFSSEARANRVGALDRKSSPTLTGPFSYEPRPSNACDNNALTLAQRKVDASFLRDSPLWKYDTRIHLTIPEESFGPGSSPWNVVVEVQPSVVLFVGGIAVGKVFGPTAQSAAVFSSRQDFRLFTGVSASLSHALNDGTKTLPKEWHSYGDWSRSAFVESPPDLSASFTQTQVGGTQAAAQSVVDQLSSFDWGSYYVVGSQMAVNPRKVQASLYITEIGSAAVRVAVFLRFTYELEVRVFRSFYYLTNASFAPVPPFTVTATFGYGPPSLACTRRFPGVEVLSIAGFVPIEKWRQFAFGQEIELQDDTFNRNCRIQLQSA